MKINYWQDFEENQYYHIYNRSNGGILLFKEDKNYSFFLEKWDKYLSNYFDLIAFCLMGNHFHFTAKVKAIDAEVIASVGKEYTKAAEHYLEGSLSYDNFLDSQFKRMFHSYSISFNNVNDRKGSLFQPKYKKVALKTLSRVIESICYTHHNPIHHNVSPYYDVWRFSSYRIYLSNDKTKLARELGTSLLTSFLKEAYPTENIDFVTLYKKLHEDYHDEWLRGQKWKNLDH